MSFDSELAKAWVFKPENAGEKFRNAVGFLWHHRLPALLSVSLSPIGLVFGVLRLTLFVFCSTGPILLTLLADDHSPGRVEYGVTAAIAVALVISWLYDQQSLRRADTAIRTHEEDQFSINLNKVVELTAKNTPLKTGQKPKAGRPEIIGHILKCIEQRARLLKPGRETGHFAVTLLAFSDHGTGPKMIILDRSATGAPTGQTSDATQSMAYYVATRNARVRTVHDFRRIDPPFEFRSLTHGGEPNYRSIAMLPLPTRQVGGQDRVLGVVSLDSEKPYEFWSIEQTTLRTALLPFLTYLNLLLDGMYDGVATNE